MKFLCLHGRGTCAQIFEMQTAAIREEFPDHEFVFIDGIIPTEQADGATIVEGTSYGFLPATVNDPREVRDAVAAVADYAKSEGPFDGVMGFSEGAILAATLLVEDAKNFSMGLKCGIFFSGGLPLDPELLGRGCLRCLDPLSDGKAIQVPTAIILEEELDRLRHRSPLADLWGQEDIQWGLVEICEPSLREVVRHNLGHQIPTFNSPELNATLKVMERTIDRATELYIES